MLMLSPMRSRPPSVQIRLEQELTVSREVGDTADRVALHFDIGAEHLADKRLQAAKLDDQKLVLR